MPQVRYSFPAWRLFIHGVEVTDDVSSVNTTWGDARSPGLAEFVLASPLDRYITTPTDIRALYDDLTPDDLDVSSGEDDALVAAIKNRLARVILDETKRRVLQNKVAERINDITQPGFNDPFRNPSVNASTDTGANADDAGNAQQNENVATSVHKFVELSGSALRFPFQVGQCIFHTGDPVRIMWRDPFDTSQWYFAATGTVADWREEGEVNGKRTVTITVEDALRPYRMARIAANPAIFDINVVTDKRFDYLIRNWHVDLFKDKSLPEAIHAITFGEVKGENAGGDVDSNIDSAVGPPRPLSQFRYGIEDKTEVTTRNGSLDPSAIGLFNRDDSEIVVFGSVQPTPVINTVNDFTGLTDAVIGLVNENAASRQFRAGLAYRKVGSLEEWQRSIDHVVPTDIDEVLKMCIPSARAAERVILAQTPRLPGATTLDPREVITRIGTHPELYPVDFGRLMMLIPQSLGPAGDLSVMLRDLGNGVADQTEFLTRLQIIYNLCQRMDFSFYATPRGDIVCEMPLYSFRPEDFGVYADRYSFNVEDTIRFGSHFQHDKIRTLFVTDYAVVGGWKSIGLASQIWSRPGAAALQALIPQFGLQVERTDPWLFKTGELAASYYAQLKLSQMNADAWMENIETVIRLGIGPNRPCYFAVRDFIATLRNVNASIVWGKSGSVNQQLKLNYRRGWSGQLTPNDAHVYETYGGRMAQPIDYSMLFQQKSNASEESTKELEEAETVDSVAESASDEEAAIKLLALKTQAELKRRGVDAVLTSVIRPDPRTNETLKAHLRAEAALGNETAAADLALFNAGIDPHYEKRAFDLSAGRGDANAPLLRALRQIQADDPTFFPKGTRFVDEHKLNHIHVQHPRTSSDRKEFYAAGEAGGA